MAKFAEFVPVTDAKLTLYLISCPLMNQSPVVSLPASVNSLAIYRRRLTYICLKLIAVIGMESKTMGGWRGGGVHSSLCHELDSQTGKKKKKDYHAHGHGKSK